MDNAPENRRNMQLQGWFGALLESHAGRKTVVLGFPRLSRFLGVLRIGGLGLSFRCFREPWSGRSWGGGFSWLVTYSYLF